MGKRTFESLPNGPLPKRKNIALTSIPEGNYDKYYEAVSLGDAIDLCENEAEVYIIGGASLFKQALVYPEINTMYITWIHAEVSGDAYFPKFDENEWKLVSSERHEADEKNEYAYTFAKYEKKVK